MRVELPRKALVKLSRLANHWAVLLNCLQTDGAYIAAFAMCATLSIRIHGTPRHVCATPGLPAVSDGRTGFDFEVQPRREIRFACLPIPP